MSSLLDHLDSNQSENDDIHLLFPKCKPRASSVGTESQSSESQSNSQQYLADNFRDQNLNHPSGGSRQSSRRHSSGFTQQQQQQQLHHHNHQQQHHLQQQQLPDNLLKHSKHSSYPPLLTSASSPTSTCTNNSTATFIGHGQLSPYDNNNVAHEHNIGTSTNNKVSDTRSSSHNNHHHQSRSTNHHHHHNNHQQHHQQHSLQSDSSDNFPLTPSFSSNYIGNNSGGSGGNSKNNKIEESHRHHHPTHHHNNTHHHHHTSSNSIKSHHHSHSRSKNSVSSRNSRHEIASALPSGGSGVVGGGGGGSSVNCQNPSSSSRHHHHHNRSSHSNSDRPHRSKKLHMTESSSCEPISPAVNKSTRYKSQKSCSESGPTKSFSTLSLGSGMECDHLDDRYEDGFCRGGRGPNPTSNGASYGEHSRGSNMPGNGGCLRDSRIEIAGGREIYSQNRIRAGRRLRGSSSTSSSTEMMADSSITASSSSSAGTKNRRKSPNVQVQQQQQHHHHHSQQQQQPPPQHALLCTNGDDVSDLVWEPKHAGSKGYQEAPVVGSRSHHSSSHRHHGSQHHHHHHHQSHARSRHVCGYPHCDHAKVLSPTDLSPACGSSSYKSSGPAMTQSHNNSGSSATTPMTVKETVFSTEITSIEKPIEPENNSKRQTSTSMQPPYVYETEPGGEIIFDDIGNWGRNGGERGGAGGNSGGAEGLCIERPRKESMKRSPSGRNNARPAQLNFFHSVMSENEGGMQHCCGEQLNHSGSGMKENTPTVLLQRSPSPSTRGGNTTPSGYESDEYSGVTPVSLNMMGCSSSKACLTNNRLIGAVPIAEYEGSPKRYGLRAPTHPMPTHLDLVDVDMQMDSSGGGGRSNSEMNSGATHHVSISLMSPSQSKLPAVPTTASSSSSSLDNTNSNASSTSSNHRNLYGSRISPRVLSPSQSVSNFPARVPGFPQRITPVTSSLDSSSLVDSGLEKSEATDTKGDNLLDGDIGTSQSSGNNDECPQDHVLHHNNNHHHHHHQHHHSNTPPQTHHHHHHQQQEDSIHHILSTDNEELAPSSSSGIMLCQGQLITSDHSSDLLLTDQLNMKPEKSNPSGPSNLSLDGSDSHHLLQQHSHHVLDLDERGGEDHHHQSHSTHQSIHLPTCEDGTPHNSSAGDILDDQCLISVPCSTSMDVVQLGDSVLDGHNLLGAATSSEYLYEFSETRKVLEEFFGSAAATGIGGGASSVATNSASGVIVGLDENTMTMQGPLFDELDYTLRRQAGNSYVGQRLAGDSCTVEESPKKPARRGVLLIGSSDGDGGEGEASPRLISFQEITLPQIQQQKSAQNPPRDLNDNDIDGDTSSTNTETDNLGDTEVGLQVGLSRNFTLSPETTDCDSNELESEISLDYEASLHSSSRVGVSMPAVEDGLSSGNVSDTEDTVPSSEQLNNDLKRTQQSLLSSVNNTGSSNNCSNGRQLSSIGVGKVREQQQQQLLLQNLPSGQLIEDGLGRNGVSQNNTLGLLSSSSSTCSTGIVAASACVSVSVPQQQQQLQNSSQTSPTGNNSSSSSTKIPSDPNPTLLLMKKQISEIEKEIKMRASQQNQKMQHNSVDSSSGAASATPSNSNCSHNNPLMAPTPPDEGGSSGGGGVPNISSSTMNTNGNGNSCGITNGNGPPSGGLASQLNVSSCPDVSTLSSTTTGQGSTCYPQTQVATSTSNNNSGHHRTTTVDNSTTVPLVSSSSLQNSVSPSDKGQETTNFDSIDIELEALDPMRPTPPPSPAPSSLCQPQPGAAPGCATNRSSGNTSSSSGGTKTTTAAVPINIPTVSSGSGSRGVVPDSTSVISPDSSSSSSSVAAAIQDIKEAIQRTKTLPRQPPSGASSTTTTTHVETSRPSPLASSQSHADAHNSDTSPVWVPRQGTSSYHHHRSGGGVKDPLLRKQRYDETPDDDADTDQETDRLLGQTRTEDDYGFYDEKEWKKVKNCRSLLPALNKGVSFVKSAASGSVQPLGLSTSASSLNTGAGSNSSNNHGVSYPSSNNTIAPSSARISPAPFKQQEPLPSSQLNSSSSNNSNNISNKPKKEKDGIKKKRSKEDFKNPSVLIEGVLFRARYLGSTQLVCEGQPTKATRMLQAEEAVSRIKTQVDQSDLSSETEPLGTHNVSDSAEPNDLMHNDKGEQVVGPQFEDYLYAEDDDSGDDSCAESEFFHKGHHLQSPTARSFQGPCFGGTSPADQGSLPASSHFGPACGSALPGTMFRLKFVGSLEVDEESGSGKRRRKRPKKTMVEEAVMKMKAPEGETQPSTEVDLFISTEKIMVLNTDLKEIMMDHALRTISYIADIGDLVVLMARRRPVPSDTPEDSKLARPPKMICHVFESDEAQYIAQSIGQAFQVAYMEFLKANGIEDQSFVREMDYQEVLNSQEIFGDELQMFAKKELQKEVVVPKSKGEILGVVIVESGWGSMLPTVVIANLAPAGAAARCGQLNIGDQIIAINGVSLVGLPLSTCQNYIKNTKSQTVVKLTVVPCPPVVEVKIKRPDTKYQLGFSVQNGVICSLLRGGIAERGGVRVGHRIIEINGQSVVAVPHEKIVNLLATSVGEINMKTMPTSMFRLLTGQETPLYI